MVYDGGAGISGVKCSDCRRTDDAGVRLWGGTIELRLARLRKSGTPVVERRVTSWFGWYDPTDGWRGLMWVLFMSLSLPKLALGPLEVETIGIKELKAIPPVSLANSDGTNLLAWLKLCPRRNVLASGI